MSAAQCLAVARCVALGGDDPHVLHANRAAALAAAGDHADAVDAADAALALEHGYVKAHYRKANALVELSRYAEGRAACTLALSLPDIAPTAKQQLEALVVRCDAAAPPPPPSPPKLSAEERKAAADAAKAQMADEMAARRAKALAAEGELKAAQARAKLELEAGLAEEESKRKAAETKRREQLKAEALAANERTVAGRVVVAARLADAIDDEPVDVADGGAPARSAASLAASAAQQAKTRVDAWRTSAMERTLAAPRVPSDFLKQYALLRKDLPGLYAYLRLIPSETLRDIFKPEISDVVLVTIADAIAAHLPAEEAAWAFTWLDCLTKVGRFDMTVLMLDKKSQAALARMFDALAVTKSGPELAKLRKAYLGKA